MCVCVCVCRKHSYGLFNKKIDLVSYPARAEGLGK